MRFESDENRLISCLSVVNILTCEKTVIELRKAIKLNWLKI